ncbi:MAG TPA: S8 family serine peptidase [Verrucomicrobiae bacterium]|nr:S8 family serine peptidase [Verrucomicrobiae bacterium]
MTDKWPDQNRGPKAPRLALVLGGAIVFAIVGWIIGTRATPGPNTVSNQTHASKRVARVTSDATTHRSAPARSQNTSSSVIPPNAKPGEAILRFKSDEALRQFIANPPKGIRILGSESRLRAVRIGFDDPAALEVVQSSDTSSIEFNFIVSVPEMPDPDKVASLGPSAPFGNGALAWLGASDRPSSWGAGVKVAVLDAGIQPHPALAGVTIRSVDLMGGSTEVAYSGHATAVASLLAGSAAGIPGVSPGVEIFDIRVLDASGTGDSFTLASGILRAADMGAQVITLSLGTYGDSPMIRDAVDYALARNIAIVAAAGNDGYANLTYPARYPGVIAVGAIDATGATAPFSNSGQTLAIVAPGTAITAAWLDGQTIAFSGTSASVPLVSGAIAYVIADQRYLSPSAAAEIVLQNADDAGPPGNDPAYGYGTLDLGRLEDRQTTGLHDLAIASHWVDPAAATTSGSIPVQITVQNLGTVTESYAILKVTDGQSHQEFTIVNLAPGAISTRTFTLNQNASGEGAPVFIQSSVSRTGVQDIRPANNQRTSVLLQSR